MTVSVEPPPNRPPPPKTGRVEPPNLGTDWVEPPNRAPPLGFPPKGDWAEVPGTADVLEAPNKTGRVSTTSDLSADVFARTGKSFLVLSARCAFSGEVNSS